MPITDKTDVTILLDRSGSMHAIRTDITGGFDSFIETQRRELGECAVTLVQFDDRYETVFTARAVTDVPPLELQPRGMTALLDAIGRTINATRARLSELPDADRPGSVILVIITDGLENASVEFTRPTVRSMIEAQEQTDGWTFLYLGANQDAVVVGRSLGVDEGQAITYDTTKAGEAMDVLSNSVSRFKAARRAGLPVERAKRAASFDQQQRHELNG